MNPLRSSLLLLALLLPLSAAAQQRDFGTEYSLSASFKIAKGWKLDLSEEIRLTDNSSRYTRSESSLMLQYSPLRRQLKPCNMRWRIGAGYAFLNKQNSQLRFYCQHRFVLQSSLSRDFDPFRLTLRLRWQSNYRNPAAGSYRLNPQNYLRLRAAVRFGQPDSPWSFDLSDECLCRTGDPKGNFIDENRLILSASRQLDRTKSLTISARLSRELQVKNPQTILLLGLGLEL